MSTDLDRNGHRPARGYRWADAEPGNLLAVKSGFWIDPDRREEHRAELEEIEAAVAESYVRRSALLRRASHRRRAGT